MQLTQVNLRLIFWKLWYTLKYCDVACNASKHDVFALSSENGSKFRWITYHVPFWIDWHLKDWSALLFHCCYLMYPCIFKSFFVSCVRKKFEDGELKMWRCQKVVKNSVGRFVALRWQESGLRFTLDFRLEGERAKQHRLLPPMLMPAHHEHEFSIKTGKSSLLLDRKSERRERWSCGKSSIPLGCSQMCVC